MWSSHLSRNISSPASANITIICPRISIGGRLSMRYYSKMSNVATYAIIGRKMVLLSSSVIMTRRNREHAKDEDGVLVANKLTFLCTKNSCFPTTKTRSERDSSPNLIGACFSAIEEDIVWKNKFLKWNSFDKTNKEM